MRRERKGRKMKEKTGRAHGRGLYQFIGREPHCGGLHKSIVVPFLAHNGQHDRVTVRHMTIASRRHNRLPALVADLTPDIGRTSVFPQVIRFRMTMVVVWRSNALKQGNSNSFFSQQVVQTSFLFHHKPSTSIRYGFLCLSR